jgi:hypothetical protein
MSARFVRRGLAQSLVAIVLVVSACASGGTVPTPTTSPPPSPPATPAPMPDISLNKAQGTSVEVNGAPHGLHIQLVGVSNQGYIYPDMGVNCQSRLVLAGPALHGGMLRDDELQALSTFFSIVTVDGFQFPAPDSTPLPATLRWVGGARMNCNASLQITNTSAQSLQIARAGVKVVGRSVANSFPYALVDLCTIESPSNRFSVHCGGGSLPVGACEYLAKVQVAALTENSEFSAPVSATVHFPNGTQIACPEYTLQPGHTVSIALEIDRPANQTNVLFRVIPELTLTDGAGTTQQLAFPELGSNLAYADPSQFTCYGLHSANQFTSNASEGHVVGEGNPNGDKVFCV